jgi:hypothetical protein
MMARLESGEVLLTTSIREVFERVLRREVARDAALCKFAGKGELIEGSHARRLAEAQPPFGVVAAGQLDLHMPLAFAWPQWQGAKRLFVNFERDGHEVMIAAIHWRTRTAIGVGDSLILSRGFGPGGDAFTKAARCTRQERSGPGGHAPPSCTC